MKTFARFLSITCTIMVIYACGVLFYALNTAQTELAWVTGIIMVSNFLAAHAIWQHLRNR